LVKHGFAEVDDYAVLYDAYVLNDGVYGYGDYQIVSYVPSGNSFAMDYITSRAAEGQSVISKLTELPNFPTRPSIPTEEVVAERDSSPFIYYVLIGSLAAIIVFFIVMRKKKSQPSY